MVGAIRALFARNGEEREGPKMMGREDGGLMSQTNLTLAYHYSLPDNFCHGDVMPRTHNHWFYLPDFDRILKDLFSILPVL